jgi:hypothetical protein
MGIFTAGAGLCLDGFAGVRPGFCSFAVISRMVPKVLQKKIDVKLVLARFGVDRAKKVLPPSRTLFNVFKHIFKRKTKLKRQEFGFLVV